MGWEGQAEKAEKIVHKSESITHLYNGVLSKGWVAEGRGKKMRLVYADMQRLEGHLLTYNGV